MRLGRIIGVLLTAAVVLAVAGSGALRACDAGVELLITEFMALNIGTRADENSSFEDWIEIHNPCLTSVDLGGWHLTDDPANLTKWQFPSVTLLRGDFLLVFASGKDRAIAGSELHTNFKLASGGEYLALVKPDGTTIQQEFSPTYPPQFADVSFGLPQSHSTLVSSGDTASYHVPTIADSGLGSFWTTPGFDVSSWASGPTGFGFTTGGSGSFDVTWHRANISVPNLGTAEAVISDPITHAEVHTESAAVINYLNTGSAAHFGNDAPYPGTQIGQDVNDHVTLATGNILIPSAGLWTFGVNSDDGFGLELARDPWVFESSFPGTRGASDTLAVFDIPEPGSYAVRLVSFDRGGSSELEFFAAQGNHTSYSTSFRLVGDVAGGGLALGSIGALIRTDLLAEMQGINATLWSRIEFQVADPGGLDLLELEMAYEDGFVAYLNGTQVASSNAPLPPQWDSTSSTDRPVEDSGVPERLDLTDSLLLLQPGPNILAVHGLNETVSDGDFLVHYAMSAANETDGAADPEYFSGSTPGLYNAAGYPGIAGMPFFSHPSGTFTDPFSLSILAVEPDAVIRFTTDGSEPTETNGTVYSDPLTVAAATRIRARVFVPGLAPGPVGTRLYSLLAADVLDFDSNLPIVIVDTFGGGLNVNFLTETLTNIIPKVGDRVSITDPPQFQGPTGLRLRGSSSLGFPKKQYFMEAWDVNREDLDVSLLGMPAESDWILYAPYSDKALMRNVLSYKWSNDIGRYAVRTELVEVYLKTGGSEISSSNYVGVYALTEKIKRNPQRVNITNLDPLDSSPPEVTGGYILKKDRLDPGDAGFLTAGGQRLAYVDPKEEEITQVQADYIKGYMDAFEAALNGPDFDDPDVGYAAYIDVDSFIDHHLLVELTKNIDGFRLSTFMFKDRNEKLNMGPIWDYNLSLGNANYLQGWLPTGWYNDQIGGGNYPWWDRLFEDEEFELRYADRWFAFRRAEFQTQTLLDDIDGIAALLDEAQARNYVRWPVLGVYVWPNWFIAETYAEEIAWMKQWLTDRLEWMDSTFFAPPVFNHPAGEVPTGFNLTITAQTGTVYFTTDGTDPRLPDGGIAPTASEYVAPLVLTVPIRVQARTLDGAAWSALNDATFYPLPLAVLNEVMPDNQSVHADELGEFDPWIELYNPFSTIVDLSGLFLTDDLGVPEKWPIPAGTTLCSNLWLVIWADGETAEGPLHANFTLNPSGGSLYVFDQTGFLIDSLTYPALAGDVSYGRRPDGGAQLSEFSYATPRAANPVLSTPIIVNEYNAVAPTKLLKGGGSDVFWGQILGNGGEWFELVVTEDHLDLRGWKVIVDDGAGASSSTLTFTSDLALADLRSGTIITVSAGLPSDVSYDPANGDWWINLRAGSAGDGLYISNLDFSVSNDNTQITVLDDLGAVVFGPAGEGIQPQSGIGSDEVFKLEEDPGPFTTEFSNYNDGTSSTFGAPNQWGGGLQQQNFGALRSVVLMNCTLDSQCDDANPCTDDICAAGVCSNAANAATCDDSNPCTDNDVCSAGACRGEIVESCCIADCECDDGIQCTTDLCVANVCVNDNAPTGNSCDDGDPCTVADSCDQGACLPGAPPDCTAFDDQCNVGVCNPLDGQCEAQPANEGGACDDGDLCNDDKTCSAGVCSGGTPVDCSTLDDDCNLGVCTPGIGCEVQPTNEAGACDDGDLCTEGATCSAGVCGAPLDCSSFDDSCNTGVCNGVSGVCEPQALGDGTSCDDPDACTTGDSCQSGVCTGGPPPDCDDVNECTDDSCDSVQGCVQTPVVDGTTCDDGDLCTESDSCLTGVCGGDALDCSFLDETCNAGVCDPGTGVCGLQPANEGADCDDLDLCTENDACGAGVCGGTGLDCTAEDDACHVGTCNPGSGLCEPQELSDGTSCDDSDACTDGTTCSSGVCGTGAPVSCDDLNSCTVDSCDTVTGCVFTPDDDQDGNSEPDPCDDSDLCTVADVCGGGVCAGVPEDCSTLDDQCNVGVCNAGSGGCEPLPLTTGTPCDDGDACTVGDSCNAGACASGGAADCDDLNSCTIDSCDSGSGCANVPDVGASCDDGNGCTETDVCDGTGLCTGSNVTDGTGCDDLDPCTDPDTCLAGACGGAPMDCTGLDDDCNAGWCNPASGACESQPSNEGGACDDGTPCTDPGVCTSGVCDGPVTDCSFLDDSCNLGVCNGTTGECEAQPVANGTPCDDGDFCTDTDVCTAGVCGGPPVDCSLFDDDCNVGVCEPGSGTCVITPTNEGGNCDDSDSCTSNDTCSGGICAGTDVDCSFLDDDCNLGACNPDSGSCVQQSINEGGVCADGDACTEDDSCVTGACIGAIVDCSGLDDACNVGVCNPGSGACEAQPVNDGQGCDDNDLCTEGDSCQSGMCSGTQLDCSAHDDACNVGTCDLGTGICGPLPVGDGTGCDDGDFCTEADACQLGICVGQAIDCDDGNECTSDSCSVGTCVYGVSGACGVGGAVLYYRDSTSGGFEPSAKPVPAVDIDVDGDFSADAVTVGDGTYLEPDRAGSLSVSPLAKFGAGGVADANGAISSFDAANIAQHSVQVTELSAMQQVAADVSGNGTVTSFDAALVAQLSVQFLEHLPVAVAEGSDWAFFRCDAYVEAGDQDCTAPVYVHDPLTQTESDGFHAVLYGDVTGNWQPAAQTTTSQADPRQSTARAGDRERRLDSPAGAVAGQVGSPESQAAELDRRLGVELRSRLAPERLAPRGEWEAAATAAIGGWTAPLASGQQRDLVLSITKPGGILALDLKLGIDADQIEIVNVRTVAEATDFSLVTHEGDREHAIGMYGVVPLDDPGPVLIVTVKAIQDLGRSLPIKFSVEANEKSIPVIVESSESADPRRRGLGR